MTGINMYAKRSKISEAKFRQMVKLFAIDLYASQVAAVTVENRNIVNRYLMAIRKRIAEFCQRQSPVAGEVEVNKSYFGPRRVKDQGSLALLKEFEPLVTVWKKGSRFKYLFKNMICFIMLITAHQRVQKRHM